MKIKCGTDIIEIARIKEAIESNQDAFLNRIYTENEITYCESKKNMKYQHYAARFAAKEAMFKAISELLEDKYQIGWKEIQIQNDENGRPKVQLLKENLPMLQCDISLSHCKEYAIASVVVILE